VLQIFLLHPAFHVSKWENLYIAPRNRVTYSALQCRSNSVFFLLQNYRYRYASGRFLTSAPDSWYSVFFINCTLFGYKSSVLFLHFCPFFWLQLPLYCNWAETTYVRGRGTCPQQGNATMIIPCQAKKLHRFIFAIALSELHLLRQFLAHVYFNKFPIIHVFHILYIVGDGKPA